MLTVVRVPSHNKIVGVLLAKLAAESEIRNQKASISFHSPNEGFIIVGDKVITFNSLVECEQLLIAEIEKLERLPIQGRLL